MGKRKYSLHYLASWMNDAWFEGESYDGAMYESLIEALLSMDGLKHVWIVSVKNVQGIAVRYTLAQELLKVVAKRLYYPGPIAKELPWIENKAVYHKLIGDTLPSRFELKYNTEFFFDAALPENQKYLGLEEKPKKKKKNNSSNKKNKQKVRPKNHTESEFNIHEYCKQIRPFSEFSKDKYEGYLVFFTKKDEDQKWHMVVARPSGEFICGEPSDSMKLAALRWALKLPQTALMVRDPFMDLSMLFSTAGVCGNRGAFERVLLKVPLFQASEAICAKYFPSSPSPSGPLPASQGKAPLVPNRSYIDTCSEALGKIQHSVAFVSNAEYKPRSRVEPRAKEEPSPTIQPIEPIELSAASESDLDFSSLSLSLASLDDEYIPL